MTLTAEAPTYAPTGELFEITGNTGSGSRPVQLEKKQPDGTWAVIDSGRSGAIGKFLFRDSVTVVTRYRVVAPAADGKPRLVSDTVTVFAQLLYDDFSGTELKPWWHNRDAGAYTYARADLRAVEVSNGTLKLRVMKDPENPGHVLTGHIGTKGAVEFVRGHIAARVKFHRHTGAHSCVWLQGGYGPNGAEIDSGEYTGDNDRLAFAIWTIPNQDGVYHREGLHVRASIFLGNEEWWESFHVVETFWNNNGYTFYVDGTEVGQVSVPAASDPAEIILSILVTDFEYTKLDQSNLGPQVLTVDWVRAWR